MVGWGVFEKKVFEKFGWHGKKHLPLVGGWVLLILLILKIC
jgi:hypothetical protein